jgi:glycosidase
MGYDVSDYKAINPEYGTMADFDRLIAKPKSGICGS